METVKNHKTNAKSEEKYFGEPGVSERTQYEFELTMDILGEKLKQIRKEQRLTQEQLGKMIGVQKAQISKLERGNNSATISTVLKVFQAMKATVKFKIEIDEPIGFAAH
jgi:HTH-type transcriptional regulator/antitoxin HipB